jgi:hypothetical protein
MDIFAELRAAVLDYDDWATPEKRAQVIDLARRFVGAVDQQAAAIEHMRQHVTPSEEALRALLSPNH